MEAVADWFTSLREPRRALVAGVIFAGFLWAYLQSAGPSDFFSFTVIGIAEGSVFAVAAMGLVVTYSTTGVFNFAHGAVGMIAAFVYYSLTVQHGWPVPLAIVFVLLVLAPIVGLLLELVMRFFKDAAIQTTIVVTIALTVMLIGLAQQAFQTGGGSQAQLPQLIGGPALSIFGAHPSRDNVAYLVVAIAVTIALRFLLFRSRTGTAMRAVVDNPDLAALNGAPATTIARYSWILGCVLAALAGVLIAPSTNPLDPIVLTFFVAGAYGAAVIGRLKSLPLTFVGALGLGLIKNYALFALPQTDVGTQIRNAIPGLFLFAALLLVPAARLSVGRIVGRRPPRVPTMRSSVVRGAVFVAAMVVLSRVAPSDHLSDLTRGAIFATLLLSLVLLTGFSGQVSLCQYVFMAMGAWAMGHVLGADSLLGIVLGGIAAVPLGVIVAFPAMRLQGLYLALVTFGFADASRYLLLENPNIFGHGDVAVGRLHLFGVHFDNDRMFFLLCTIVFALFALVVLMVKRGPFGRRLAALRDSQAACATLGLDVRRTKLVVFGASAFVAGVAGSLFGGLNGTAGAIQFDPINNIVLFLFAMVGGVTTITGALLGGALFALLPYVQSEYPDVAGLAFGVVAFGAIALGRQPNGLAGLVYDKLAPARGARRRATPANQRGGRVTAPLARPEVVGAAR